MLKKPLITEKTMDLSSRGDYTFVVNKGVSKLDIAKVVAVRFGVDVTGVRMINTKGKTKTQRTRKGYYLTPTVRKAIVSVKKGQKIALFESAAKQGEEVAVETAETKDTIKEKKSLLRGTKVKIEKSEGKADVAEDKARDSQKETRQLPGKTKGEK